MIPEHETFNGTWPFSPRFFEGNGFRMHYVDEGSGDPIVCLHGEPTWGYLYRKFIPALSTTHRVVVPDHMGFGKSETPRDREYSLRAHVANFSGLIEALDLCFGLRAAQTDPESANQRLWPWCRQTGWRIVKDVMQRSNIVGRPACPRGLRHGFGVGTLQAGVPLNLVQRWLGHANMTTTAIYLQAMGAEEREIAARMWAAAA